MDLGLEYLDHLRHLNTAVEKGLDREYSKRYWGYVYELMVRTINHATNEALWMSRGPEAFLSLDNASFVATEHVLVSTILSFITSKQSAVDRFLSTGEERTWIYGFWRLAKSCGSGRHIRFISALCRVSGYIWLR
jgi:hypothetical protein